ncbi:DegT/DnrJ/EryC1/StrS family aminotransferase [Patescibacteria group bacterium]|nr:DegT/DnrJ/EryC1/StrS family aminotransferase [Patescibacteria group bacterium]MBU1970377.1 DegT/DnrJ/EryC1/StrS family aminotransferase [Patescibacteria group bacterium]
MISISKPYIDEKEQRAVLAVLASKLLARGSVTNRLEQEFAKTCGVKYAVAVSSGTAALHVALCSIGIGKGDEVITTPFTFVATAHAILMTGARPVLADIDSSFNISSNSIQKFITKKTKAILAVDLYGRPADYVSIKAIAAKHKLYVVEDAAQAIGSTYQKKKAGGLGDIGCFSLYATKNITTGEGGMITTNDKALYQKCQLLRHHSQDPGKSYEYLGLGFNYEITDLASAIGIEQLKKLRSITKKRISIAKKYNLAFKSIKGLIIPDNPKEVEHVYHQYTLRVTAEYKLSRDGFVSQLNSKGIMARIYYPKPLYYFSHIKPEKFNVRDYPNTEKLCGEVVSIPVHPGLTHDETTYIIETIRNL